MPMSFDRTAKWTIKCVTEFISEHYPEEAFIIPTLPKLVETLPTSGVFGEDRSKWHRGLPIDKGDNLTLAAPFAIMTVWSVLHELQETSSIPTKETIERAIQQAAETFGANAPLAAKMRVQLTPKLVALFTGTSAEEPIQSSDDKFLVDWFTRQSFPGEDVSPERERVPVAELDRQFRQADGFMLRVDETAPSILVGDDRHDVWGDLRDQARRMLFLMLDTLKNRVLQYDRVEHIVFENSFVDEDRARRSRIKREVFDGLRGVLQDAIKARPKAGQFERQFLIPYYWIRDEHRPSRLLGSPTTTTGT